MINSKKMLVILFLLVFITSNFYSVNVFAIDPLAFSDATTLTADYEGTHTDTQAINDAVTLDNGSNIDSYTKLLLHNNGADASTTFIDSSTVGKSISTQGDVQAVNTSQYKFGDGSAYFDGTGDYISTLDNEDFNISTGDFTVDYWVKRGASGVAENIFGQSSASGSASTVSIRMLFLATDVVRVLCGVGETTYSYLDSTGTIADTNWHHIAVVKSGNTMKLYIDGVNDGSVDMTGLTISNSSNTLSIGRNGEYDAAYFTGYIDEFRLSKGIDRWTSNFTPSTLAYETDNYTKLLLHFNTENGFIDSSGSSRHQITANGDAQIDTAQYKLGGASGYFDGTGDYIELPDSDDWNVGAGDFTIEFWIKRNTTGTLQFIAAQNDSSNTISTRSIQIYLNGDKVYFNVVDAGSITYSATTASTITDSNWHHIACVRNGNTILIYLDGTQDGTTGDVTGVTVINSSNKFTIGRRGGNDNYYFDGWIDEFRFSKGIARWTNNFTPPTNEYTDGYVSSGTYTHSEIDISSGVIANDTKITYNATTPVNTSLSVEARVYNGTTWSEWVTKNSGDTLVTNGTNLTGYKVQWRANLSTSDTAVTPNLDDVTISNNAITNPVTFNNTVTLTADFNGTHSSTAVNSDAVTLDNSGNVDSYTKLLLHNNGSDASTIFTDSSTIGKEITVNGNTVVSTAQSKYGDSSCYFDGTGDYLSISDSEDWDFGTGDFTIDFWVKIYNLPSIGQQKSLVARKNSGGTNYDFAVTIQNVSGTTNLNITTASTLFRLAWDPSVDTWYHVEVSRNNTDLRAFIDGTQIGTTQTSSGNISGDQAVIIGISPFNLTDNPFNGYIDELRISKGVARHTVNFTPLSSAYITDSYTKLLLQFEGGFVDNSESSRHQITANGNAQIDTAQYKFGGASGYFDGTGDYIDMPDSEDWNVGAGDFTVDCWIKRESTGTTKYICGQSDTSAMPSIAFLFTMSDTLRGLAYFATSGNAVVTSTGTITDTNWHHVAFVRDGNTLRLFIDGIADGTADVNGAIVTNSTYKFAIGRSGEFDGSYFNGWIDEFRFSNGIARWTSNFTPPTNEYSGGYVASGTYTHSEIDVSGGVVANNAKITFNTTTPENTTAEVQVRVYDGSSWSSYTTVNSGDTIIPDGTNLTGYMVQWRANLSTSDSAVAPSLDNVTISNLSTVGVTGVSLNKSSTTIAVNNTETLIVTVTPENASNNSVTWSSSNEAVATVNTEGVVSAVSVGSAVITVTTDDGGYTATCNVTTENRAVTGISIDEAITIGIGHTRTLVPTFIPSDATNKGVTWSSSNTEIATVDANGTVTALNQGTAIITVTTDDGGFTDTCSVSVSLLSTYTIEYEYDANGYLIRMTISEN